MIAECTQCGALISRYECNTWNDPCGHCGFTILKIFHVGYPNFGPDLMRDHYHVVDISLPREQQEWGDCRTAPTYGWNPICLTT